MLVTNMAKSFPKRKLTNDLIICGGDMVVAYQTVEGINDGPLFGGIPATGKSFNFNWIDIYRFKYGKVVERWGAGDARHQPVKIAIPILIENRRTERAQQRCNKKHRQLNSIDTGRVLCVHSF